MACGGGAPASAIEPTLSEPVIDEPAEELPPPGSAEDDLPTQVPLPTVDTAPLVPTTLPSIPERRRLTLEFPPQIRAGDSDRVRLTLEVDDFGLLTPTAEVEGNVVTGEVIEILNVYETHHVIVGAQFNIAGLVVDPADRVSQSLAPGQSVTFFWSILPQGVGVYRGTIWLYLTYTDKVSGIQSEKVISAQQVEIEAVNYLGMSVGLARSVGVVGSIVGTVLGFPFLEDIVKFLFRKRGQAKR